MEKNIAVVMSAVMATSTVTSIASSYVGARMYRGKMIMRFIQNLNSWLR